MLVRAVLALLLAWLAAMAQPIPAHAQRAEALPSDAAVTARRFAAIVGDGIALRVFLSEFPKGADLHNHLSGAIYAESMLAWSAAKGGCIAEPDFSLVDGPCDAPGRKPAAAAQSDPVLYRRVVDQLSMRGFVPTPAMPTGHDQFFATFDRFDLPTERLPDMLVEVMRRNARQNVFYLELMRSFGSGTAVRLARQVGPDEDFVGLEKKLADAGLYDRIPGLVAELDTVDGAVRQKLGCDGPSPEPACKVTVRFIGQVIRTMQPPEVFAQIALSLALARADRRVVSVNPVAPEDFFVARRDYTLHMRMFAHLNARDPVPLAMHAGELALGLVPPEDLTFHIRQAIEIAGARRIGHGTSLAYETDAPGLLRLMAERKIVIEVAPSSAEIILGVKGNDHSAQTYLRAGVPIVLNTDDEGVARSDLTNEYLRFIRDWGVRYRELRTLTRNALEYSFADGASLWRDANYRRFVEACAGERPVAGEPKRTACKDFLAGSDKAREQWRHEGLLAAFERRIARTPNAPLALR
jgi:adenosine deaminase